MVSVSSSSTADSRGQVGPARWPASRRIPVSYELLRPYDQRVCRTNPSTASKGVDGHPRTTAGRFQTFQSASRRSRLRYRYVTNVPGAQSTMNAGTARHPVPAHHTAKNMHPQTHAGLAESSETQATSGVVASARPVRHGRLLGHPWIQRAPSWARGAPEGMASCVGRARCVARRFKIPWRTRRPSALWSGVRAARVPSFERLRPGSGVAGLSRGC